MAFVIRVDAGRCTGCKSCEIACALAHSRSRELVTAALNEPEVRPRIGVRKMGEQAVPVQCRHCQDAPCAKACPHGALRRDASVQVVLYDPERCQGAGACIPACPYGVLEEDGDGRVLTKCDLCAEGVAAGESPACVAACPTGALEWIESDGPVPHRVTWLVDFAIDKGACKACGLCKKACPAGAVSGQTGKNKTPHEINPVVCVRCGRCFDVCPFGAVGMRWHTHARPWVAGC